MELPKHIELDKTPIDILDSIEKVEYEPEMSEYDLSFICGIIKKYRPQKCVEVGIAGGGTSAIILNAMYNYCENSEFHVVDKSKEYYHDRRKHSGFLGRQAYDFLSPKKDFKIKYVEHLGNVLPSYLDEIGNNIDFVLLDTVHILPGEVLDFLAVLPYLHVGTIVVLHDVTLNSISYGKKNDVATGVLFNSVVAEKYYEINSHDAMPNIAAFKVTEDTMKYIMNVFGALCQTWSYLPSKKELDAYNAVINKYYGKLYDYYAKICDTNAKNLNNISLRDKATLIGKLLLNRASSQYRIRNN
ncbi:class I SAM-dependent methyltransferase [Butyrivibrio sp. DSM 10294]|nr:class I SAM-dependent methyltransferase [Butyrivibrio sp. DSM 10294]